MLHPVAEGHYLPYQIKCQNHVVLVVVNKRFVLYCVFSILNVSSPRPTLERYSAFNRSRQLPTVRSVITPADVSRQNISQLIASVNAIKDDVVAWESKVSEVQIERASCVGSRENLHFIQTSKNSVDLNIGESCLFTFFPRSATETMSARITNPAPRARTQNIESDLLHCQEGQNAN